MKPRRCLFAVAACLLVGILTDRSAIAGESWMSRLNPLAGLKGDSPSRTATRSFKPAARSSLRSDRSKPTAGSSLFGRTLEKVGDAARSTVDSTKTAFGKTREFLSPSRLMTTVRGSGGSGRAAQSAKRNSSQKPRSRWSLTSWFGSKKRASKTRTPRSTNDWLKLPQNMPE